MSDTDVQLVRSAYGAFERGDLDTLRVLIDPDVQWHGSDDEDPQSGCRNRDQAIAYIENTLAQGLTTELLAVLPAGDRVVAILQADRRDEHGQPRPHADLVTVRDEKIISSIAYDSIDEALRTARTPTAASPASEPANGNPDVERLVPFIRVTDVERSAAFYRELGFQVKSEHRYRERLAWVALQSAGAETMLEHTDQPIDSASQGIVFYLYSHDLATLRRKLLAAGIDAGEIENGSPGPSHEMRVTDPDGYVLMVAQIER